ncbi:MAG: hypothetical protein GY787_25615 [Alteromonadales bacterium]|nr:hypothetical protein [Alteromonadales bacterium]
MKKYIYPSLVGSLTILSLSLLVFVFFQSSQITHYKKLYFETDKMLEEHLVAMHSVSSSGVVFVVHEDDELKVPKQ